MDDDRQIAKMWRVNRTIRELVRDRGYDQAKDEVDMPLEVFKQEYAPHGSLDRSRLNFYTQVSGHGEDRLFVFYSPDASVGVKTMRQFLSVLEDKDINRGIIIWSEKMTAAARKVIESMRAAFELEDFDEAYLLVNITHHQMVPKHEVLSDQEKKDLLTRYRLKETQLPRIQLMDPVARYFGVKRGQVFKITRASETSGRYCSYRVCL